MRLGQPYGVTVTQLPAHSQHAHLAVLLNSQQLKVLQLRGRMV